MKKIKVHSLTGRITPELMRQAFGAVKRNRAPTARRTSRPWCGTSRAGPSSPVPFAASTSPMKRKNYNDNRKLRARFFGRKLGLLTLEAFRIYRDHHGQACRVAPRHGATSAGVARW